MNRSKIIFVVITIFVVLIAISVIKVVAVRRTERLACEEFNQPDIKERYLNKEIKFYEFVFVEYGGRDIAHRGYFPIQGLPTPGKKYEVRVKLFGAVRSASIDLIGLTGNVLAGISLAKPAGSTTFTSPEFYGTVVVPNQSFYPRAKGLDCFGHSFVLDKTTKLQDSP